MENLRKVLIRKVPSMKFETKAYFHGLKYYYEKTLQKDNKHQESNARS